MKNRLGIGVKVGLREAFLLVCSVMIGFLLLVAAYLIPQDAIYDNVKSSVDIMYTEWSTDEYYHIWKGIESTIIDYFTDGLILNTSYTETGRLIEDVLLANRVTYEGERSPMTALYSYLIDDEQGYSVVEYARYWHGYQIFIRPLLLIMSISSIRFLNMTFQILLVVILLLMTEKKKKGPLAFPFIYMWLALIPVTIFNCIQYSSSFYSMMFTSLLITYIWHENMDQKCLGQLCLVFEFGGILMAYFDILTYPLVGLGVPLILFFSLDAEHMSGVGDRIRELFAFSVSWMFGYAGMWFGKWLIASLFTGSNILKNAFDVVAFRTSHGFEGKHFTWFGTINENLSYMKNGIYFVLLAMVVVTFLFFCAKYRLHMNLSVSVVLCIVSVYPFIWYYFAMNHSMLHAAFTWRELVISIYGFASLLFVNLQMIPRKRGMRPTMKSQE